MKNLFRYVVSLIIPSILFLVSAFILGAYVNKNLSLYFYIASGAFFVASVVLVIVWRVQNSNQKKISKKEEDEK